MDCIATGCRSVPDVDWYQCQPCISTGLVLVSIHVQYQSASGTDALHIPVVNVDQYRTHICTASGSILLPEWYRNQYRNGSASGTDAVHLTVWNMDPYHASGTNLRELVHAFGTDGVHFLVPVCDLEVKKTTNWGASKTSVFDVEGPSPNVDRWRLGNENLWS